MDLATAIGMIGGLTVVLVVMIMDGGTPAELLSNPSAILLTLGGSLMATTITTSLQVTLRLPKLLGVAFSQKKMEVGDSIELLVKMADKARKEGLLALEEDSRKIKDEFLQKGLMMVVDGIDQSQIRAIMETNVEQMRSRHRVGYSFFSAAGGFSPTFGIIGTVMGLISVLKQLDNPSLLAKAIASAFLATLWGLLIANLIYLPIGSKLKSKSDEEAHVRYMQIEGILAIQAGENPRIVRDKLISYLPPAAIKEKANKKEAAAPVNTPQPTPEKAKA
jgi:chemotaxis protein MotA